MTFTTPNGIRRPDDPQAYADIIKFFQELSDDVDQKFLPLAGDHTVNGTVTVKTLRSSNGGTAQSATVLQTGPVPANAFTIYDDNTKIDNSPGRRLWIAGANGTDVAIRTRSTSERLNRISLAATTMDLNGAVTINGTLNVTDTKTIAVKYESTVNLAANVQAWTAIPSAPGFTFKAPPSGAVTIGYGAMLPAGANSTQLTYRVRLGATLNTGTIVLDQQPAGWASKSEPPPHSVAFNGVSSTVATYSSVYTAYLLGSLAAGSTYNVVPYYMNLSTAPATLKLYRHYFIITPDY